MVKMGGFALTPLTKPCRHVTPSGRLLCKGCKGKRGLLEPSFSHPEKPSSSRQKRVFLRFDPIGKNGGVCPYTPYKTVSTRRPPLPRPPTAVVSRRLRHFAPNAPWPFYIVAKRQKARRRWGEAWMVLWGGGFLCALRGICFRSAASAPFHTPPFVPPARNHETDKG